MHRVDAVAVRARYLLLALLCVPFGVVWFRHAYGQGLQDWLVFEFGARTLVHYNHVYSGGAFSLYAKHPFVQIGPPPLWFLGALQWMSPRHAAEVCSALGVVLGLVGLRACELTALRLAPHRAVAIRRLTLVAGIPAMAVWSADAASWRHLDDIVAVVALCGAMAVVARTGPWWLAGGLVGLSLASKPWAIAAAPLLIGLPRKDIAKASLAVLASAAFWWLPFVLGDPGTLDALSGFRLQLDHSSALRAMGVGGPYAPIWARPAQMAGGFLVALLAARYRHWTAALMVAFAIRIMFDPQVFAYYGIAPLLAAVLLDLTRRRMAFPAWTLTTYVMLFLLPYVHPDSTPGSAAVNAAARLSWSVVILLMIAARSGPHGAAPRPGRESMDQTAQPPVADSTLTPAEVHPVG